MKQEDKELLLKDLSARLPYTVHALQNNGIVSILDSCPRSLNGLTVFKLIWDSHHGYFNCCGAFITDFKPYLRPLTSMTDKEREEYRKFSHYGAAGIRTNDFSEMVAVPSFEKIDYLNSHHFDYRGLIEKGLAIAVTKDNNPYK